MPRKKKLYTVLVAMKVLEVGEEELETTATHPFRANGKWTDAKDLREGDELVLADGNAAILERAWYEDLEEPVRVYNFEVEDFHTYYVGSVGVLVHNSNCFGSGRVSEGGGQSSSQLTLDEALKELDKSGLRPGQDVILRSQLDDVLKNISNNYDPSKAYSSVYSNGPNRYLVEGHHTTVAFKILGKNSGPNMNIATTDLPSTTNVFWTKKWYQFGRKAIKIVD